MTPVIETILRHRSIRAFTGQPIEEEQLQLILESGIAASSSSLLQAVSVIRVTDPEKRAQLAELAGPQPYVASAAEFLVFCIDYHRHFTIASESKLDSVELTLIGAVDAGIMAQNCLLAAESLGLGGVYIGGLRNQVAEVDKLLQLPEHTAVLFGMCLGYPDQDPERKPRFNSKIVVHENSYQPVTTEQISQYDQVMKKYYQSRGQNTKSQAWSDQIADKLSKEQRPHMLGYLHDKGLAKK